MTGNEKLIATTKSAQRTFGNPLKKDVETFNPRENNATEIPNGNHNLSWVDFQFTKVWNIINRIYSRLSTKPNIPSIIEDVESPLIHIIQKKNVNYDADDVESFTPEYNVPHNAHKHRQRGRNGNQLEIIDEFSPQAGRLKSLIAVHLNGDTSQYMMGVHTNYRGMLYACQHLHYTTWHMRISYSTIAKIQLMTESWRKETHLLNTNISKKISL